MDPEVFFTEPRYDGYPAILVRLAAIDLDLSAGPPPPLVTPAETTSDRGAVGTASSAACHAGRDNQRPSRLLRVVLTDAWRSRAPRRLLTDISDGLPAEEA